MTSDELTSPSVGIRSNVLIEVTIVRFGLLRSMPIPVSDGPECSFNFETGRIKNLQERREKPYPRVGTIELQKEFDRSIQRINPHAASHQFAH